MQNYDAEGIEEKDKNCFEDADSLTRDFQSEVSHNQQGNLPYLMAVTTHSFGKLFNMLVKHAIALEGDHGQAVTTEWNKARKLLILQQKHLYLARTRDKGLVAPDGELQLVNVIPEYQTEEENLKKECPESAIRMLLNFSGKVETGSGVTIDLACEEWLQSAFAIFRVQNLTKECLKGVLFRKLLGDARLLITTHLSALDITIDQLSLKSMISILESQYMAALLSPVNCLRQLHAMGRIKAGRYLEGVGHICRLAKLSCRLEGDATRKKFLIENRSVETFRNSLSPHDQQLLSIENSKRTEGGHEHMTALKSARFLQAAHLAKQGNEGEGFTLSDSINRVEQTVFEEVNVNYIGKGYGNQQATRERPADQEFRKPSRGRAGFQNQFGGTPQRGSFPRRETFNPRGNGNQRGTNYRVGEGQRKFGQKGDNNRGFAPNRGFPQNRGQNRGFGNQRRGFPGQSGRGRGKIQQGGGPTLTRYPTALELGVTDKQCFLCGSASHRWHQRGGQRDEINRECPYAELHRGQPRLTKCHKHQPPKLGHHPAVCLGDIVVRQVQESQAEEDYDFNSLFGEEAEFGYE
jgi:hypothetical protein